MVYSLRTLPRATGVSRALRARNPKRVRKVRKVRKSLEKVRKVWKKVSKRTFSRLFPDFLGPRGPGNLEPQFGNHGFKSHGERESSRRQRRSVSWIFCPSQVAPKYFEGREKIPTHKIRFSIWTLLRTPGRFTTRPSLCILPQKCP